RKPAKQSRSAKSTRKAPKGGSRRRGTTKRIARRRAPARKAAPARKSGKKKATQAVATKKPGKRPKPKAIAKAARKVNSSSAAQVRVPRLDRARRTLDDSETKQTPPSSLDMDRHGSAARTGRAEIAANLREHHGMNDVTGGDPDVDIEDAYFAGEEAPGGDNPTPDQDIVEDIGKALGVTYDDSEELKGANKLEERDKHRWELDPASAEDYTDHDKEK
ncbi:MAG: DUF6335 family protein, partial [Vicinamibacterales bacterium]